MIKERKHQLFMEFANLILLWLVISAAYAVGMMDASKQGVEYPAGVGNREIIVPKGQESFQYQIQRT